MKLKNLAPNCHEMEFRLGTVLFSYETPVAVALKDTLGSFVGVYKTDQKFSNTTTKHIKAWTATTKVLPQNTLEKLANSLY